MSNATNNSRPTVVKLGGAALDAPETTGTLWQALREMHASLPGGLILVHGGGKAVDRHLAGLDMKTERIDGLRVTPDDQIDEVVAILAGVVNKALVAAINQEQADAKAVGLCLSDGGLTRCEKLVHESGDLGRVGQITDGDPSVVNVLLESGFLPVVASIGMDEHGAALNINADDAAAGLARVVGAASLVLLTDVPGINGDDRRVIDEIDDAGIERLIDDGVIEGGMIPKSRGAASAAQVSGVPAIIASWKEPDALATLAAGEHVGTRVLPTTTHADRAGAIDTHSTETQS